MKIKKFKSKQILKLHLLNLKTYEYITKSHSTSFLTNINLTKVISDFKKFLHIIFEYHQANKKILFVGLPSELELSINRLTPHLAVNRNFELQNLLMNNSNSSQQLANLKKQSLFKTDSNFLISKSFQKPDLVVLLAHEKKQSVLVEKNLAKIPFIIFCSEENQKNNSRDGFYNLTGFNESLVSTPEKSLLFLGLNFIIKQFKK